VMSTSTSFRLKSSLDLDLWAISEATNFLATPFPMKIFGGVEKQYVYPDLCL